MINTDPRTPDVTDARAAVMPFIVLLLIIAAVAGAAYFYWPEMQQVLRSSTPTPTTQPTP